MGTPKMTWIIVVRIDMKKWNLFNDLALHRDYNAKTKFRWLTTSMVGTRL